MPTLEQTSAGGVAFRRTGDEADKDLEIALILVGPQGRWQLPKGRVDPYETAESAAMREVREEAGIETQLIDTIEEIEYWFYANENGQKARIHKYVQFFLLQYRSGDPGNHDHEVNEARWVEINQALEMLEFSSEKMILEKARSLIEAHSQMG
jgi:8-oxo-dGTP pyrophosphatase MutT (NUDIX family)